MTGVSGDISTWNAGLGVRAFFTARRGGVSAAPFDSLNLSRGTSDAPEAVAENRARVEALAGAPIAYMSQKHGSTVAIVTDATETPEADAIVTMTPGFAVAVLVADCVPLLLHDSLSGAVAAVHAGRMGVANGVVGRAVEALVSRGGDARTIEASIGPAICGACYEVPSEMRDEVAALVPAARATTTWGTPSLDLPAAVRAQLEAVGVGTIAIVGPCTRETPDLFSHRREGETGRSAGVIVCGG